MRICHLTSVHVPFDTRIFHKECRALVEAGHEVHLIARYDRDETVDGVHVHPIPSFKNKVERMLKATIALYQKALAGSYEVCHFHDPELIPVGILLKLRGKTVVYDVHEDYPVYFRHKEAFPALLRIPLSNLINIIERFAAGRFDAVVTVTPTIQKRFRKLNSNSVMIRNFPSFDEITPTDGDAPGSEKSNTVAYVGSLTLDRGVEQMVRAIGIVRERMPVRLLMAGDFGGPAEEEYIRDLPEYAFVDYRGHTSRKETIDMLAEAKAGLVVCHPRINYMHAYPTKLFEYMAAGIPVVASNFPLWRDIVEDAGCGYLVNPMNPGAIADAIIRLLTNPREANAMGTRGREAVREKYTWDGEKKALLDLYSNLDI